MSRLLRKVDWLSVRLFAGWVACVVIMFAGVRLSFRPNVDSTIEVIAGHGSLIFGVLLMGAWFRWCTRVSAEEAQRLNPCDHCAYYAELEDAIDTMDHDVQQRIRSYRSTAQSDLERLADLAATLAPEALSGHGLLTHDGMHPETEKMTPVASPEDTGRHWRRKQ